MDAREALELSRQLAVIEDPVDRQLAIEDALLQYATDALQEERDEREEVEKELEEELSEAEASRDNLVSVLRDLHHALTDSIGFIEGSW